MWLFELDLFRNYEQKDKNECNYQEDYLKELLKFNI